MTVTDVLGARRELREILRGADGVPARGKLRWHAGPPIDTPFGSATPVEGTSVRAVPVEGRATIDAAFTDGIQKFSVESWVNGVPVVRGYAAAGILSRESETLVPFAKPVAEEFVVAPLDRLSDSLREQLMGIQLDVYDAGSTDRAHPLEDLRRCGLYVERRRRQLERRVCEAFQLAHPDRWLVVDGSLRGLDGVPGADRRLGLIKSHETQFLAGVDQRIAVTLPTAYRTTVFTREGKEGDQMMSWYVRLWDWAGEDLLFGLVRLERPPGDHVVEEADWVSGWMMGERAPVANDSRWDRLVYPMHRVEEFLRTRAGGWA